MSVSRREQLRALLVRKDQPGASQVHVDSPTWTAPKKKPRRQQLRDAIVAKLSDVSVSNTPAVPAPDPGLYVGRMVQNAQQLRDWWATTRLASEPEQLDADTHCTVLYSRAAITVPPDLSHVVIQPEQLQFGVLGAKNAVVLFLDAPLLVGRNQQLHAAGAVEDYPSYRPHITLFYLGAGADTTDWRDGSLPAVPTFPIVLGPELSAPLGSDVYQAAKLPSWYVGSASARTTSVTKTEDDRVHVTVHVQAAPAPNVEVHLPPAPPAPVAAPHVVRKIGEFRTGADGVRRVEITETTTDPSSDSSDRSDPSN